MDSQDAASPVEATQRDSSQKESARKESGKGQPGKTEQQQPLGKADQRQPHRVGFSGRDLAEVELDKSNVLLLVRLFVAYASLICSTPRLRVSHLCHAIT
jgi:hypothetical protein